MVRFQLLAVILSLSPSSVAYVVTNYYQVFSSAIFTETWYTVETTGSEYSERSIVTTEFDTTTLAVYPTATATLTPVKTTTITETEGRVTFISAEVSGSFATSTPTDQELGYYVWVTYSQCSASGNAIDPITKLAPVYVPPDVIGHLTPTSINTSIATRSSSSEVVTFLQGVMNPTDIDAIDVAAASYGAQPVVSASCARATTTVDYRSICSAIYQTPAETITNPTFTSTAASASSTTTSVHCGDLNPCCYGCHWYGLYGVSYDFMICDDGRKLDRNGSVESGNSGKAAHAHINLLFTGTVSLAVLVALLML